jgi:type III pantothenate kinase
MLLTIDAGNTNTVFALIEDDEIIEHWRLSTSDRRTVEEYIVWISHLMKLYDREPSKVEGAIIASVVPQVDRALTELCQKYFNCEPLFIGRPGVDLGIDIKLANPNEVGADRLVNAVAADAKYGGPLVVVDFGTATNFDVVGNDGSYLGGLICPGINLSLSALHQAAAKLPKIAVEAPEDERVTGKSTLEAMQFGVFWGYLGMIEGLITRLKKEHGDTIKVIATGGLAPIFADRTNAIDFVADDLTLIGLKMIFDRN